MKKLEVFLVACVYVAMLAVCCGAAYDDESIIAAHIEEQGRLKILDEQSKTSNALHVELGLDDVSLAYYYNESNNGDSESAPYIIDSLSDLKLLQERVNAGIEPSGKYYRMDSDIDLSSETEWTGIGFLSTTHPFDGHFDGNHKTITVNNNGTIITTGLFYTIKSSGTAVKDLTVKGTVKSSSTTVNGSVTGATAAGIVYELASGTLENCVFNGMVEAESTASNSCGNAAGIVAYVQSAGSVKNCSFSNGTVKATGGYSTLGATAGGIVDTQYGTVSGCTTSSGSTVYAFGGTSYAGGITAFAMSGNVSITNCTSNATISGATYQGGILGRGTSSTVLSGNSYTGANKEVGNGSTNNNSGNNSSSNSHNGNTGSSGGGGSGCNVGLCWAGFMLGALVIMKRKI